MRSIFPFCLILSLIIFGLPLSVMGQSGENEDKNRDLQVLKAVKPVLPPNAANTGITEGFAVIVFIVDNKGKQFDFVDFASSHSAFARSSIRAIKRWEFAPRIVDGVAYASRVFVKVSYDLGRGGGGIVDASIIDESMIKNKSINRQYFTVQDINDLDFEPKIIKSKSPVYPIEMLEAEASGQVLVEFFIDTKGNVRAPGLKSSSNDYLPFPHSPRLEIGNFNLQLKTVNRLPHVPINLFFLNLNPSRIINFDSATGFSRGC